MSLKILVVDDEYDFLRAVCGILQDEGYEAVGFGESRAAMQELLKGSYSIVLVDVLMPGVSGLQMLEEIRSLPDHAKLPVLLMSSSSLPGTTKKRRTFDGFLPKPFNIERLLGSVKQLLASVPPGAARGSSARRRH